MAAVSEVSVDSVVADVDFPVGEPPVERGVRAVQDLVGEFVPCHQFGLLPPEILACVFGGGAPVGLSIGVIGRCFHLI